MLFIFLGFAQALLAQTYQYRYYQGEALPFRAVNCMYAAPEGSLWLGTDRGLFRFDGATYESANLELQSKTIRALTPWTPDSLLFINDRGLHLLWQAGEKSQTELLLGESRLQFPTAFFRDSKDRVWIVHDRGSLLRYTLKTGLQKEFDPVAGVGDHPHRFLEDSRGSIWLLVSGQGVYRYVENPDRWERAAGLGSPMDMGLNGTELFTLEQGTLSLWELASGSPVLKDRFPAPREVDQLYVGEAAAIFLASEKDLYQLEKDAGGRWQFHEIYGSNDAHRVERLPFRGIRGMLHTNHTGRARSPHLWIATDQGLGLLWKGYFQSVRGMPHDNVLGIFSPPANGVLISMGNLYTVFESGFREQEFPDAISGIAGNGLRTTLGTTTGWLYVLRDGTLERSLDLSDRGGGIFFMHMDGEGTTWFCQAPTDKPLPGVARLAPSGEVTAYQEESGLSSRILVVREGGRKELYAAGIGSETYLYKYDRSGDRFVNVSPRLPFDPSSNFEVHDLAIDDWGVVWLGTTDGLLAFDGERIRRVDLGPYTNREIRALHPGAKGALWVATDTEGLLFFREGTPPVRFGERSGLPSRISSYRSLAVDARGVLWMGTAEGPVFSVDPDPTPLESAAPFPIALLQEGQERPPAFPLRTTAGSEVSLRMNAFSYPADQLDFQYRSFPEGLTREEWDDFPWQKAPGPEISLATGQLGSYVYQVRARQGEGHRWSSPVDFHMVVTQPWYRNPWGLGLVAAVLVLGSAFLWQKGSRRKVRGLKAELKRRESELHHQHAALEQRDRDVRATQTHLYLLQRLVRQLPPDITWQEVWPVLKRLVALPLSIARIELYAIRGNELHCRIVDGTSGPPGQQTLEFNEKGNLPSYVIHSGLHLYIPDLEDAAHWPIERQPGATGSAYFLPFQQGSTGMAFAAFGEVPNAFTGEDQMILQLLISFLNRSVTDAFA